jgi:predicted Zn finger-like uncharacterized protein
MEKLHKSILSCPFCQKKFFIDAKLLLPKGQNVKCSNCDNAWYQNPIVEEKLEEPQDTEYTFHTEEGEWVKEKDNDNSAPKRFIRQLVKESIDIENPLSKLDSTENHSYAYQAPIKKTKNIKKRFLKIISCFCMVFTALFIFKDSFVYYIPGLSFVYNSFGIEVKTSSYEKFEIREKSWSNIVENGIPSVIVRGTLANMSDRVYEAPTVKITLKGKGACKPSTFASSIFGGKKTVDEFGSCIIDEWNIRPTNDRLLPGQITPFSTIHPYDERFKVTGVYIDFVR